LAPLSGWFNENQKITNLSYFLNSTHADTSTLTAPIDLEPLKNWFPTGRSIDNLTAFLDRTHYNNRGFTLPGQFIFPDWIKTMTQKGTAIWNVQNTFFRTFYLSASQNNNTEPTFQDGMTTLSSLENPTVNNLYTDPGGNSIETKNKGTYTNRESISPSNINWK
jgi:hypothetical protein